MRESITNHNYKKIIIMTSRLMRLKAAALNIRSIKLMFIYALTLMDSIRDLLRHKVAETSTYK